MRKRILGAALAAAIVMLGALGASLVGPAGSADSAPQSSGEGVDARGTPPQVGKMLREIDHENVQESIETLVGFGTRNTLSSQTDPVRGIGAARDWIFSEFQRYAADSDGRMTVELQSYLQEPASRIPVPTVITNVVATLRGTQPESANRMYVVSGHYDSMCGSSTDGTCDAPGAGDDASGVAAVLEMARVMSKREWDATIVFMAVAGEEQGLYGSRHYASQAKLNGLQIEGMFTNDIVGSSVGGTGIRDPFSVRLFAEGVPTDETDSEANRRRSIGGENDSPARQMARFVEEVAENSHTNMDVKVIYRRDRFGRGGDHISFLEQGYRSAVRFTEVNEDFDHQHQDVRVENGELIGDLPQYVDFKYIARVARVNAAALAALADAPVAPKDVRIAGGLSYDTSLRWDANPEPDLAGYEIVWRNTTDADWRRSIWVGNVTSFVVQNMSKDNFFFGVRAVDTEGNRSPVTFPRP
ncbi:MAG: M20/M25/M40 family metallo-hydrolase [Gaiellaceae bacterium]